MTSASALRDLQAKQVVTFLFLLFSIFFCLPAAAQVSTDPANKDFSGLELSHDHAEWPAPEVMVRNLRSHDDPTRMNALLMIGVPDEAAKTEAPIEILLRYAALGTAEEKQAILAVWMPSGDMLFGAVAAHKGSSWQRIANFSCWCKYEGGDLLDGFVKVEPSPDGYSELILHASGGGTGLYARDEVHFRYYEGELRLVFAFQDRFDECLKEPCSSIYRWFYTKCFDSAPGAVLVEAHVLPSSNPRKGAEWIPDPEVRDFEAPSCKTYKWDKKKFRYEPFSGARNPCEQSPRTK